MALTLGVFEGRAAFVDALRETLLQACAIDGGGARELFCLDASFEGWPLSEPAVLDALSAWARQPGRRLHLLALQYEDLRRAQPRFVRWRTTFDHCVEARSYEPEAMAGRTQLAAFLVAAGGAQQRSVRLLDAQTWRGVASELPADALRSREIFDAVTQRSTLSFPSTTFGL